MSSTVQLLLSCMYLPSLEMHVLFLHFVGGKNTIWVKKKVNGIPGTNKVRIIVDKSGDVYDIIEQALPVISKEVLPEQVFVTVNGEMWLNEEPLSTIGIEMLKDKSTDICICWNDKKQQQQSEGRDNTGKQ